jgi:C-terminal processing protease CtpA/Prc
MKKFFLGLILLCLIAPAKAGENKTLFIENAKKERVLNAIVQMSIEKNWNIINQTDYSISVTRKIDSSWRQLKSRSEVNPYPEDKIQFNLVQKNNGVILSFFGGVMSNPNNPYERADSYSLKQLEELYNELNNAFSGYYSYGFEIEKKFGYFYVKNVKENSPAYYSGLKDTDMILKVNDMPIKNNPDALLQSITPTKENEILKLNIKTVSGLIKTSIKDVNLTSKYYRPLLESDF